VPVTLDALIADVEAETSSPDPLALLATASSMSADIDELTDALVSHFVDRCRRAGRSWADIGGSLGVSKQAVQKRFTHHGREPAGWDRFTERTRSVVLEHAPAAAKALGHGWVGTEHLLLGFWGEPACVAVTVLEQLGVTAELVRDDITARVAAGEHLRAEFTPRAWTAVDGAAQQAIVLGHNYVGTEHVLLALVSGAGGMAEEILVARGVDRDALWPLLITLLSGFVQKKKAGGA
jgi:hypothetical protein